MLQFWFAIHTLFWSAGIQIGESLLSLNVMLLIPVGICWLLTRWKLTRTTCIAAAMFFCIILLSLAAAKLGPCEDKFSKSIITAPLLTILIIIGLEIGGRATTQDWLRLRTTAIWVIGIAITSIFMEMMFPAFFSPDKLKYHLEFKYSGIYKEPSHVAISLFPCIAILFSSKEKSFNRKGLLALLLLFVLSRSSTLFMLTLFYIAYRLVSLKNLKQGAKYLTIIGLVITIALTVNYELLIAPTLERFIGVTSVIDEDTGIGGAVGSKQNISSLIYLKGWQDALANTARTYGIGLGFNMMGCNPLPDVPLRTFFSVPGRVEYNVDDGSFLLSKVMSEFGVVGLAFFVWVIAHWVRYEHKSKEWSTKACGDVNAIHCALMFSFVVSSLLRSTGYFQGGLLLWATAAAGATIWSKKRSCKNV